jgi:23S rRNA (pseudouridine1915-N3)-methyltransferase
MIKIISVGKLKEKYLLEALNEYVKRISKYTKIELIELPDYNYDEVKTINEEGKNILSKINEKDYVVTLNIKGKKLNSIELAKFIDTNLSNNLVFVIGGSYGLSEDVQKRSNYSLSFSDLTFPHQLFRILLLEQIYRSFKINNNEAYHK